MHLYVHTYKYILIARYVTHTHTHSLLHTHTGRLAYMHTYNYAQIHISRQEMNPPNTGIPAVLTIIGTQTHTQQVLWFSAHTHTHTNTHTHTHTRWILSLSFTHTHIHKHNHTHTHTHTRTERHTEKCCLYCQQW